MLKEFNYQHIAIENWKYDETSMRGYIKSIESYPYLKYIIDRNGKIRYVEGVMSNSDWDSDNKYLEFIIEELSLPQDSI